MLVVVGVDVVASVLMCERQKNVPSRRIRVASDGRGLLRDLQKHGSMNVTVQRCSLASLIPCVESIFVLSGPPNILRGRCSSGPPLRGLQLSRLFCTLVSVRSPSRRQSSRWSGRPAGRGQPSRPGLDARFLSDGR